MDRFWAKVDRTGVCWNWTASTTDDGYGLFRLDGRLQYAHRLSFEMATGFPLDTEDVIRHSCDNPRCVYPGHLLLGTHADNVADKVERGRHQYGSRHHAAKLSEEDVRWIRQLLEAGDVTQKQIADSFGVDCSVISRIANREVWKHVD